MEISDEKKVDILLSLLNERYKSSHKMRERSLNFALWILGFGIIGGAWILLNQTKLEFLHKVVITIFILIIGFLTKRFLNSIEIGFDINRSVIIKIEDILECYKPNIYSENQVLFPEEYKNLEKKETAHFSSIYKWIWTVIIMLITLIWLEAVLNIIRQAICRN